MREGIGSGPTRDHLRLEGSPGRPFLHLLGCQERWLCLPTGEGGATVGGEEGEDFPTMSTTTEGWGGGGGQEEEVGEGLEVDMGGGAGGQCTAMGGEVMAMLEAITSVLF